jgi:hypothetical protein
VPTFTERVTKTVRDNPALTLVVALIGFALLGALLIMLRPRRKPATGTGFLSAQTGFYQVPSAPSEGAAPAAPTRAGAAEHTVVQPAAEAEKTDVFPGALPPLATLRFHQYPDANRIGQSAEIHELPFRIGRGATERNHLSLDNDTSISRRHANITFENGAYFLTDDGSSNGTAIDGQRLPPQTPTRLQDGARIMLGKNTVLVFHMSGTDREDPDKTNYMNGTG